MKAGYSDYNPEYDERYARYPGSWSSGKWYRPEDFEDASGELDKEFQRQNLVVPLYLYRHSGDVISAGRFAANSPCNCPWDSGCMGFAFVSREKVKQEFGVKRLTKSVLAKANVRLRQEVEVMNMYLAGEVYGIEVIDMVTDRHDSCWGFYCNSRQEVAACARDMLDGYAQESREQAVAEALVA